ncbi:MAG: SpoIIE family protein phosphatase [Bacteroidetes bacterium]|nr:SpoIIE family protein phosphatase [Bacteroidota bacterium]
MTNPVKKPTLAQVGFAVLTVILFAVAVATFYTMASLPTDENVFRPLPSSVFVTRSVPALSEGEVKARQARGRDVSGILTPDSIQKGDLLISLGARRIGTLQDFWGLLRDQDSDSLRVRVYRPVLDAYFGYAISRAVIDSTLFRDEDSAVVVTDVTPGGASDRAGMKVGDLIVRINGQKFKTDRDADATLRRGKSGTATVYEILRNDEPLSLTVTLAQFGFPISLLVIWLSGLLYMAIGSMLLLRRPELVAARTLGLTFLGIGLAIAVIPITREPDPTWFTRARTVLVMLGVFLGYASAFHAHGVFPAERRKPVYRRWVTPLLYIAGALSPLLLLAKSDSIVAIVLVNFLVAGAVLNAIGLEKLPPQYRRIVRVVHIVTIVVTVLAFSLTGLFGVLGVGGILSVIGILVLFIPLSYVYVIGRYRLLGLDFRMRRNVQYTVLSAIWGILLAVLFVRLLVAIPGLSLQVPGIHLSGLSVEINPAPTSPAEQVFMERLVMMLCGIVLGYVLWRVRKGGQRFIDRKYYRTQFDYRKAASSLSEVLSTRLSMDDTARGTVDTLADLLKLKSAGLLVFRNGQECCCEAVAGMPREEWNTIACAADRKFAEALAAHTDPVRVELLEGSMRTLLSAQQFQCAVPIRSKDRLVGVLLVGEKLSETPLGVEDLSFLSGVAKQLSVSIENAFLYEELTEKERMRHELNIARRIQLSSLPSTTPQMPGLDIAGLSTPALEVGGDFFDYLNGDGRKLMVIVGDVSGKGTSAALYMSKIQGILRSLHEFDLTPRDLFVRANRLLCQDLEKSSFVTALGARFVTGTRRLTLVRAGHVPLFLYRASSARVERVLPRGLGLGLNDAGVFASEIEERNVDFGTGDIMVFVTDGVLEARNASGEEFGEDRIAATLAGAAASDATAIRDRISGEVQEFGRGLDQHDDQTVVVVRAI